MVVCGRDDDIQGLICGDKNEGGESCDGKKNILCFRLETDTSIIF